MKGYFDLTPKFSDIVKSIVSTLSLALVFILSMAMGAKTAKNAAVIERGKYLARISGCITCHTPMRPSNTTGIYVLDKKHLMSGAPQGSSFSKKEINSYDMMMSR